MYSKYLIIIFEQNINLNGYWKKSIGLLKILLFKKVYWFKYTLYDLVHTVVIQGILRKMIIMT